MKNYKQILEAVNRGIKFALDDFEDNNEIKGQSNSKVKYQGGINEYLDLLNEVIDLGLPSGTLWCKYNLDVNSNQLSRAEDWYGKYYAWGELEPKRLYNWFTYEHADGNLNTLTKYCNNSDFGLNGFTDNLTELLPEDDAAYQNKKLYNYKFHIPTKEQCEELIKYTNSYWVNNYDPDPNKTIHYVNDEGIKGLNGRIFIGKNKNQLFIPAASCYFDYGISLVGSRCNLLSSSLNLDYSDSAYYLDFRFGYICIGCNSRCNGYSIRPVINL